MKAVKGLIFLALVSASSAAAREDDNDERQRRIAEMRQHMSRHLRKDGGDPSQAAPAHALRQDRESDGGSREFEPSVIQDKKAGHADKIRRVAEQLGQQHRQRHQVQGPRVPELQRVHSTRHSLVDVGQHEMERKPAVVEAAPGKTQDKKRAMHKIAEHMSHTFDPKAVRHDLVRKGGPRVERSQDEVRAIRQDAAHVAAAPFQDEATAHIMGMQHKIRAAHRDFTAGPAKDESEGESKQANDGHE